MGIIHVGVILNPRKENINPPLKQLNDWAAGKDDISFWVCTYGSKFVVGDYANLNFVDEDVIFAKATLLITLGGDGTILRTIANMPNYDFEILGVNLGGLGFLAATAPNHLVQHLEKYLSGHYRIDKRVLLECRINGRGKKFNALNDIVIDKAGFSRVIQIDTKIDKHALNSYIADGMIISSPTGSTGHSLSAGGPIVVPNSAVFTINPICPHSLSNRPVIISDSAVIDMQVFTEADSFNIIKDGQRAGSFPTATQLSVRKFKRPIKFVEVSTQNFLRTLSSKLNWGEDFRNKKRWTYEKQKQRNIEI